MEKIGGDENILRIPLYIFQNILYTIYKIKERNETAALEDKTMTRKAFGSYNARNASTAKQARNIAESMLRFAAVGKPKSLAFYGVVENSELGQAVLVLMAKS